MTQGRLWCTEEHRCWKKHPGTLFLTILTHVLNLCRVSQYITGCKGCRAFGPSEGSCSSPQGAAKYRRSVIGAGIKGPPTTAMADWMNLQEAFSRITEGRTSSGTTSTAVLSTLVELVPHSLLLSLVVVGVVTVLCVVFTCSAGCVAAWLYCIWALVAAVTRQVGEWWNRPYSWRGEDQNRGLVGGSPVVVGPYPVIEEGEFSRWRALAEDAGSSDAASALAISPSSSLRTAPAPRRRRGGQ